jgi:hypothetical protein
VLLKIKLKNNGRERENIEILNDRSNETFELDRIRKGSNIV